MTKLRYVLPFFIILLFPVTFHSQSSSDVNISGSLAPDKIKKRSHCARERRDGHSERTTRSIKQTA